MRLFHFISISIVLSFSVDLASSSTMAMNFLTLLHNVSLGWWLSFILRREYLHTISVLRPILVISYGRLVRVNLCLCAKDLRIYRFICFILAIHFRFSSRVLVEMLKNTKMGLLMMKQISFYFVRHLRIIIDLRLLSTAVMNSYYQSLKDSSFRIVSVFSRLSIFSFDRNFDLLLWHERIDWTQVLRRHLLILFDRGLNLFLCNLYYNY